MVVPRRAVKGMPGTAVKGFIQVNMHVAHRRQHQLTACIIVWQRGIGMAFVITQGDNFAVINFECFQLGRVLVATPPSTLNPASSSTLSR